MVAPLSRSNSTEGHVAVAARDQYKQSHTELVQFDTGNNIVIAEESRGNAITTKRLPFNNSFRIWTLILARCLPKDMSNFSLASHFCHAIYRETLYILFRPRTGTAEDVIEFLASDVFKKAIAGDKSAFPKDDNVTRSCFEALFAKNMRLDKICHGDLLQTGKLLLNFDSLYSERKLKSLNSLSDIELFLKNGANPNILDEEGNNALLIALKKGLSSSVIELLLNHGVNPNIPDEKGNTALHIAFSKGYDLLVVLLLLEKGADPNVPDTKGETFLQRLVAMSRLEMALYWEKNSFFIVDDEKISGAEAMIMAEVFRLDLMQNVFKWSKNKAALINTQDKSGNNLLQIAFNQAYPFHTIQLLLQEGVDPNVLDINQRIPLLECLVAMSSYKIAQHWNESCSFIAKAWKIGIEEAEAAAEVHRLDLMKCLFKAEKQKLDPNKINTFLLIALENGFLFQVIELLLNNGANPNIKDEKGNAALHIAFSKRHDLPVILLLLEKGADPNVPDKEGKTLLQRLIAINRFMITLEWEKSSFFIVDDEKISGTEATVMAEEFRLTLMRNIFKSSKNKADLINTKDENGNNLLQIAFNQTYPFHTIQFLLQEGVDPNVLDKQGRAAWHILLKEVPPPYLKEVPPPYLKEVPPPYPVLFDVFQHHFKSVNFNPLRSKADRIILQTAQETGHHDIVTFLRNEMQNTLKVEIEAKYFRGFAWLGRLFNRIQIWWFGL